MAELERRNRTPYFTRKLHRIGAIVAGLPILAIIGSGLFLQLKKELHWIQPTTHEGSAKEPSIGFDELLRAVSQVPEAEVRSWKDVERIDIRPAIGMAKVLPKNNHEVQVDTKTGAILQVAYRRSDLIESIHDGSFFHDRFKLWVVLPSGVILFALWISGVYLWLLPYRVKRRRARSAGGNEGSPRSGRERAVTGP